MESTPDCAMEAIIPVNNKDMQRINLTDDEVFSVETKKIIACKDNKSNLLRYSKNLFEGIGWKPYK